MKLLLDECIPRRFKNHLAGHECPVLRSIQVGELVQVGV